MFTSNIEFALMRRIKRVLPFKISSCDYIQFDTCYELVEKILLKCLYYGMS